MINQQLKLIVDKLSDTVDSSLEMLGYDISDLKDKIIRYDLAQFMMYLSASDGKIEWSETDNISQYLGVDLSPEEINKIIQKRNIYSINFEQNLPLSCKVIVDIDNIIWESGDKGNCAADLLLKVYKAIGAELINADSDANENEKQDYSIYINMLENYINKNDKYKLETIVYTEAKKNSSNSNGDADAVVPLNTGVSAPKKR